MKLVIAMILMLALTIQSALAGDCDYSKIKDNGDGTYTYSKELHICVGTMKKDLEAADKQVESYKQAIELKDLALGKANERITLWQDTSFRLQDRMSTIDNLESKNKIIYFALGILVTGAAVWGAGQLAHK